MTKEYIQKLTQDVSHSPLYSEDLAPVPKNKRTWRVLDLAALWVGMAVCIPTYLLASYMIRSGMTWLESLIIIGLANVIITIPMVLNGHAGVKYGVPFPVIGRASFGVKGVHIVSVARGLVACGWFGVQTWIGGLALYAIYNALLGTEAEIGLGIGKFICFALFWVLNMAFIWKGTESIKWLEEYSAPILIGMGLLLIGWGAYQTGGFAKVLQNSKQLEKPSFEIYTQNNQSFLLINPLVNAKNKLKAKEYRITGDLEAPWSAIPSKEFSIPIPREEGEYLLQLKNEHFTSSVVKAQKRATGATGFGDKIWSYVLWLTAMVGFWATMSISIADITRYSSSQSDQVKGQFIGLPGTMMLYSFVGIFVTCAAVINFDNILISNDAPWDPVSLLSHFESPWVVVVSQIFMIVATLSTNIAANVIAPSNAFSNINPKAISFRAGGLITGIIGILICPWWIMDEISGILIFVSGLLGPVLGILISDYFVLRKKELSLNDLFKTDGNYLYWKGYNLRAMVALIIGVSTALIGFFVEELAFLYKLSWFSGFLVSFLLYYLFMKREKIKSPSAQTSIDK